MMAVGRLTPQLVQIETNLDRNVERGGSQYDWEALKKIEVDTFNQE